MAMVASFIRVALSDGEASEYGRLRSKKTIAYRRPESETEGFKARAAIESEKKATHMNQGFSPFALRNLRLQTTCRVVADDSVVCKDLGVDNGLLLKANQLTETQNSTTTIAPASTETQTQKLERISYELLDLTKLERYDYSLLFCLETGLNRYSPLNAVEKFRFKDLRLISLPS
ncbi:hypothetical protein TorRG33x02_200780 [Trema orientale]|uniref:Uncharacterized protein n=1 Tax=Trema orientale TaxID=63057 RepID=A0A2P5EF71_TREOI|nr:hypothetical protein TorRG33x02_200780 [Trema orientale]